MTKELENRFHDLLVKDCNGTITESEKKKLQILEKKRNESSEWENLQIAKLDYSIRELKKLLGKANRVLEK